MSVGAGVGSHVGDGFGVGVGVGGQVGCGVGWGQYTLNLGANGAWSFLARALTRLLLPRK